MCKRISASSFAPDSTLPTIPSVPPKLTTFPQNGTPNQSPERERPISYHPKSSTCQPNGRKALRRRNHSYEEVDILPQVSSQPNIHDLETDIETESDVFVATAQNTDDLDESSDGSEHDYAILEPDTADTVIVTQDIHSEEAIEEVFDEEENVELSEPPETLQQSTESTECQTSLTVQQQTDNGCITEQHLEENPSLSTAMTLNGCNGESPTLLHDSIDTNVEHMEISDTQNEVVCSSIQCDTTAPHFEIPESPASNDSDALMMNTEMSDSSSPLNDVSENTPDEVSDQDEEGYVEVAHEFTHDGDDDMASLASSEGGSDNNNSLEPPFDLIRVNSCQQLLQDDSDVELVNGFPTTNSVEVNNSNDQPRLDVSNQRYESCLVTENINSNSNEVVETKNELPVDNQILGDDEQNANCFLNEQVTNQEVNNELNDDLIALNNGVINKREVYEHVYLPTDSVDSSSEIFSHRVPSSSASVVVDAHPNIRKVISSAKSSASPDTIALFPSPLPELITTTTITTPTASIVSPTTFVPTTHNIATTAIDPITSEFLITTIPDSNTIALNSIATTADTIVTTTSETITPTLCSATDAEPIASNKKIVYPGGARPRNGKIFSKPQITSSQPVSVHRSVVKEPWVAFDEQFHGAKSNSDSTTPQDDMLVSGSNPFDMFSSQNNRDINSKPLSKQILASQHHITSRTDVPLTTEKAPLSTDIIPVGPSKERRKSLTQKANLVNLLKEDFPPFTTTTPTTTTRMSSTTRPASIARLSSVTRPASATRPTSATRPASTIGNFSSSSIISNTSVKSNIDGFTISVTPSNHSVVSTTTATKPHPIPPARNKEGRRSMRSKKGSKRSSKSEISTADNASLSGSPSGSVSTTPTCVASGVAVVTPTPNRRGEFEEVPPPLPPRESNPRRIFDSPESSRSSPVIPKPRPDVKNRQSRSEVTDVSPSEVQPELSRDQGGARSSTRMRHTAKMMNKASSRSSSRTNTDDRLPASK